MATSASARDAHESGGGEGGDVPVERARDDGHGHDASGVVARGDDRHVARPQHREVRLDQLRLGGEVQPDLEQLERVGLVVVEEREHLRVHDAPAGGEPLRVAGPEARRGARASRSGR